MSVFQDAVVNPVQEGEDGSRKGKGNEIFQDEKDIRGKGLETDEKKKSF